MSQASLDVAREFIEAYNRADWGRYAALLASDCSFDEIATGRQAHGEVEMIDLFKGWKRAMPDSEGTVTTAVDAGDKAVIEVTWNGTLTGPMATPEGEVEPTGKHQTTRACAVFTFEGDRVKDCHHYFDSMALMQQLGLLGQPASA